MKKSMRYWAVAAKCGHSGFGKKYYVPVTFAIQAESGTDAAAIARAMPRCKHDHPDAVLAVTKISYEEYIALNNANAQNPYFHCASKQEQCASIPVDEMIARMVLEPRYQVEQPEKEDWISHKNIFASKTRQRHPKHFYRYHAEDARLSRVE